MLLEKYEAFGKTFTLSKRKSILQLKVLEFLFMPLIYV